MAVRKISFILNGEDVSVEINETDTILTVLREQMDMTSLKSSCRMGECGACTIIIDKKAVNACLTLAATVEGKTVETLESLGDPNHLHPIQKAFKELGAFQCGFCTPGFVMSAKALLDVNPMPTREEVREALSGNLCRCTGYVKPVEGVLKAAEEMQKLNREDAVIKAAEMMRER